MQSVQGEKCERYSRYHNQDILKHLNYAFILLKKKKEMHFNFNGNLLNVKTSQRDCLVWVKSAICYESSFAIKQSLLWHFALCNGPLSAARSNMVVRPRYGRRACSVNRLRSLRMVCVDIRAL